MKTVEDDEDQDAVETGADAAEDVSPSSMFTSGTRPPSGVKLSCMGVDRAAGGVGGDRRVEGGGGGAEARSLSLHIAERLVNGEAGERAVAGGFCVITGGDAGEEEHAHRGQQRPPLLASLAMRP